MYQDSVGGVSVRTCTGEEFAEVISGHSDTQVKIAAFDSLVQGLKDTVKKYTFEDLCGHEKQEELKTRINNLLNCLRVLFEQDNVSAGAPFAILDTSQAVAYIIDSSVNKSLHDSRIAA